MTERKILLTEDGSHTLYVPEIDESYHSTHGAVQESRYIFIECALRHRLRLSPSSSLVIFEVGFGTGLNAFLTAQEVSTLAEESDQLSPVTLRYRTIEKFPLDSSLTDQLNYARSDEERRLFADLHASPWTLPEIEVRPHFLLTKIQGDFTQIIPSGGIDVVYFDAFSPEKEPTLWTQELFDRLFQSMNVQGVLTTYCAKGVVRRMLQSAGFQVERLPGPPGKREILRGVKP